MVRRQENRGVSDSAKTASEKFHQDRKFSKKLEKYVAKVVGLPFCPPGKSEESVVHRYESMLARGSTMTMKLGKTSAEV